MSPEQGHGQTLDERSDLYSLGVIFYEMLTRKKPFLAPTPMAVIYMHGNAPIPLLARRAARCISRCSIGCSRRIRRIASLRRGELLAALIARCRGSMSACR